MIVRFEVRTGTTVVSTAATLVVSIESDGGDGVIYGFRRRKTVELVASGGERKTEKRVRKMQN
jgi:hypothetical protein